MYRLGIDLGGTNIAVGLVDEKGNLIDVSSKPTLAERANKEIIKDMADLCLDIIKANNLNTNDIKSIGIGSPGTCDIENGIILYAFNLGFENENLQKGLNEYIDLPVYVANDADVVAYGELKWGAGKGHNSIAAITIGTGIGGGVIIDNKIVNGSYNRGGEWGHSVISVNGRQCTCGRKGCWEAYSSATGLINMAEDAMRNNMESLLYKYSTAIDLKINGKIFFKALSEGDDLAKEVYNEYLEYMSEGLANIVNMLEPEVIIIGGGISAQGDVLLNPLKELVYQKTFGNNQNTEFKIAELGNNAGIIGAAFLGEMYE